jgi:hypothetical protein
MHFPNQLWRQRGGRALHNPKIASIMAEIAHKLLLGRKKIELSVMAYWR